MGASAKGLQRAESPKWQLLVIQPGRLEVTGPAGTLGGVEQLWSLHQAGSLPKAPKDHTDGGKCGRAGRDWKMTPFAPKRVKG